MNTPPFSAGRYYLIDGQALRFVAAKADQLGFFDDLAEVSVAKPLDTLAMPVGATEPSQPVTPRMAAFLTRIALAEQGLVRTSMLSGGSVIGLTDINHHVMMDFNLRFSSAEKTDLIWTVTLSGKPHLEYNTDDERHYPIKPESLVPKIVAAFTKLGLPVAACKACGWQTSWDDDVHYQVTTPVPAWINFEPPRMNGRRYD